MILDKIVKAKRMRLGVQKNKLSQDALLAKLEEQRQVVLQAKAGSFSQALMTTRGSENGHGITLIAEIKKASPSKGLISDEFDYLQIASQYEQLGAAAISVLTEEDYFLGSPDYLQQIRERVQIPLLRKDFIIDSYQIYEAKLLGADAILLIVCLLSDQQLKEFMKIAEELGLDCLVEAHDEQEVKKAVSCGAKIIGINNRDLKTFHVNLDISRKLGKIIPKGIIRVSESGIHTIQDINAVLECGFDAVLIGEALMKAGNITGKFAEFGMETKR